MANSEYSNYISCVKVYTRVLTQVLVEDSKGSLRRSLQAWLVASTRSTLVSALILWAGIWSAPGAT